MRQHNYEYKINLRKKIFWKRYKIRRNWLKEYGNQQIDQSICLSLLTIDDSLILEADYEDGNIRGTVCK